MFHKVWKTGGKKLPSYRHKRMRPVTFEKGVTIWLSESLSLLGEFVFYRFCPNFLVIQTFGGHRSPSPSHTPFYTGSLSNCTRKCHKYWKKVKHPPREILQATKPWYHSPKMFVFIPVSMVTLLLHWYMQSFFPVLNEYFGDSMSPDCLLFNWHTNNCHKILKRIFWKAVIGITDKVTNDSLTNERRKPCRQLVKE